MEWSSKTQHTSSSGHFIQYAVRRYFHASCLWKGPKQTKTTTLRSHGVTSHLCLRLRWTRGGSSDGALKMDLKMGTYFLKMTAETVKFLSSLSVLWRKSCARLAMSCHFFILLKNSIRLQGQQRHWLTDCSSTNRLLAAETCLRTNWFKYG